MCSVTRLSWLIEIYERTGSDLRWLAGVELPHRLQDLGLMALGLPLWKVLGLLRRESRSVELGV